MAFTLNSGEFDLGGGYVGRGNTLSGESYAVGTTTTGVQGLLNTSGLQGISATDTGAGGSYADIVFFRSSSDALAGIISFTNGGGSSNGTSTVWSFLRDQSTAYLSSQARFLLASNVGRTDGGSDNALFSHLNSGLYVSPSPYSNNQNFRTLFRGSSNWRLIARDHATALSHYPTTTEQGSVFAASCVNSSSQWGFWCAGEVGNRSGYFSRTQGCFAIVLLRNGSTWYLSVFSPNSTSRNDSILRSSNITPAAGQSGDDRFSELFLMRDQQNGYSEPLGKVPGLIYVDLNKAANSALVVGDAIEIVPGSGTTYGLTNRGAIICAQWGLDISATVSNTGAVFTLQTVSTPSSATLAAGNRNRWILENNQRIRFTATPPTGLAIGVDYWIRDWDPINFTFSLAESEGGGAIVPGSDGSSTIIRFAALIAMPCYQEP